MQLRDDWRDHVFWPPQKTNTRRRALSLLLAAITLSLVLGFAVTQVPPTSAESITLEGP